MIHRQELAPQNGSQELELSSIVPVEININKKVYYPPPSLAVFCVTRYAVKKNISFCLLFHRVYYGFNNSSYGKFSILYYLLST